MCAKESGREWSGVLFYSTTGSFGEENFSITAEFFYLMDVGTSTFTGYDYDPGFISFMMSNPRCLSLKMGHIHSHNSMRVFFSTTDTEEIIDNSEFHNYYLSLIVNNNNDMTAKIAFRGKNRVESVSHYSYRGDDGKLITGSYPSTSEEEVVYVYDCDIKNDNHTTLFSRYGEIIKSKAAAAVKPPVAGLASKPVEQAALPFSKTVAVGNYDDWEGGIAISKPVRKDLQDAEELIVKVMIGDPNHTESLNDVLSRFSMMNKSERKALVQRMEKRLVEFYIGEYPYDQNLLLFDDMMQSCVELIEKYETAFPNISQAIWKVFNVENA